MQIQAVFEPLRKKVTLNNLKLLFVPKLILVGKNSKEKRYIYILIFKN